MKVSSAAAGREVPAPRALAPLLLPHTLSSPREEGGVAPGRAGVDERMRGPRSVWARTRGGRPERAPVWTSMWEH